MSATKTIKEDGTPNTPLEKIRDVIAMIDRADRAVFRWQDAGMGESALSQARQEMISLPHAVQFHYDIEAPDVQSYFGGDIKSLNDDIKNMQVKMEVKANNQQRQGQFKFTRSEQQDLYKLRSDAKDLRDEFEALENDMLALQ